ncbi:MAG: hypothetical protein HYV35_00095 [Lentisphaerae bacterium]|nr:hypothetical protein [Lentisphaerota bacterium]
MQFALGQPAAVPDCRRTRVSLDDGKYPIARATYNVPDARFSQAGLFYEFEYFCCPTKSLAQTILWVSCSVTNDLTSARKAHAWVKVNFPIEEDLFDYHYIPFYWDATKYTPCDKVGLLRHQILREGKPIGKLVAGSFSVLWVKEARFTDADYVFMEPNTFAMPALRLKEVRDAIHLETELAPNETKSFHLALLVNYERVSPEQFASLESADISSCRATARQHFESLKPPAGAELVCAAGKWDELLVHLPISISQLLVRFPDVKGLVPTQGGIPERHLVWVWEAVCMLTPLLPLGWFAHVRAGIENIFSLQDGGCPPKGRLTTTAGAVGTTGLKWLCTTGGAVSLAADYYRYSRDEEFLSEYLPRLLRALRWIVGEIRATRRLNLDGARPTTYGLMPFGVATDGDNGHIIAMTDAYSYRGLEKGVALLEDIQHGEAGSFRAELLQYRADIAAAVEAITRPDGFIERAIVTGDPEERIFKGFDNICGAFLLATCNAIEANTSAFRRYVAFFEKHMTHGCFTGKMDREVMYMGLGEWAWQDIYLRLGEWKKAFAAAQVHLKYGLTQDTHQGLERFALNDPAFCPFQPNGSGNGRALETILKSFYFETDSEAVLLAGIPFAWLRSNRTTALRNLHTAHGRLNLEVQLLNPDRCELIVRASRPEAMPGKMRLPEHFRIISDRPLGAIERRFTFKSSESV